MEKIFVLFFLVSLLVTFFEISLILAGVFRIEKHLKTLQEDFRIFLNKYFNVNK